MLLPTVKLAQLTCIERAGDGDGKRATRAVRAFVPVAPSSVYMPRRRKEENRKKRFHVDESADVGDFDFAFALFFPSPFPS